MPERYSTTTGNKRVLKSFIETPSGGTDGGKPVALDPATNKINPAFLPSGGGGTGGSVQPVVASEAVANRRLVNFHVSAGKKCRLSLGTYDKRVSGYVATGGASGDTLNVATDGEATFDIGSTGVSDTDFNAAIFADPTNAGLPTKTAPSTTGQARQYLGHIIAVNTAGGTFTIQLIMEEPEELA